MTRSKIYVDTKDGLLDNEAMVATAQVLMGLVDNADDIAFESDSEGHHFTMPTDVFDKFTTLVSADAPKKRGRPRKAAPEPVDAEPDPVLVVSEPEVIPESEPDPEE